MWVRRPRSKRGRSAAVCHTGGEPCTGWSGGRRFRIPAPARHLASRRRGDDSRCHQRPQHANGVRLSRPPKRRPVPCRDVRFTLGTEGAGYHLHGVHGLASWRHGASTKEPGISLPVGGWPRRQGWRTGQLRRMFRLSPLTAPSPRRLTLASQGGGPAAALQARGSRARGGTEGGLGGGCWRLKARAVVRGAGRKLMFIRAGETRVGFPRAQAQFPPPAPASAGATFSRGERGGSGVARLPLLLPPEGFRQIPPRCSPAHEFVPLEAFRKARRLRRVGGRAPQVFSTRGHRRCRGRLGKARSPDWLVRAAWVSRSRALAHPPGSGRAPCARPAAAS